MRRPPPPPVHVVTTVGPSFSSPAKFRAAARLGGVIFRVNGAHGTVEEIEELVRRVGRSVAGARILLDLPGRKVRLRGIPRPIPIRRGVPVRLSAGQFSHPRVLRALRRGQEVVANDGRLRMVVRSVASGSVLLRPEDDGSLVVNKGIHVGDAVAALPLLTPRDEALLDRLAGPPVRYVGLSFVCSSHDVATARRRLGPAARRIEIVPKIETAPALAHLDEILSISETVMLDRGDLSSEIGLLNLPEAQEKVLARTVAFRRRLIVATQLLRTMESAPIPLIAELTEIHRLLERGVFALQLSEETAVGKHPLKCIRLVMEMARRIAPAGRA